MEDALKLTVYFGESERLDGELLSDALLASYEARGVRAAVLLRASEGFGLKHALRTQRLLTLSEDLPLVSIAVDRSERVEELLPEVGSLVGEGLVTLERARLARGAAIAGLTGGLGAEAKLTIYLGRQERAAGRPAFLSLVEQLRRHGVAGSTVLVGVDGMVHGSRRRARFFSRNAEVPLLVVSVGAIEVLARALPEVERILDDPLMTLERVCVLKRDGVHLNELPPLPERDAGGLGPWQQLTVYAGEQARHAGRPLYLELVRRLRIAGASGATAMRGIWGYSGDHAPHGDRLLSVRRRVPVVTTLVDRPSTIRAVWPIIDELTDTTGLVTSEVVPAFRARAGAVELGGLRLSTSPGAGW